MLVVPSCRKEGKEDRGCSPVHRVVQLSENQFIKEEIEARSLGEKGGRET